MIVDEDQQSLAIGKRGQNVRLASKLCGWDIEIKTRSEFDGGEEGAELLNEDGSPVTESSEGATQEAEPANEASTEEQPQGSMSTDSEGSEPSDPDLETPADAKEATTEG